MVRERSGYVALNDLAGRERWPSRASLFAYVRRYKIPRYRFPRDRKTYVRLADLERAMSTPRRKRE